MGHIKERKSYTPGKPILCKPVALRDEEPCGGLAAASRAITSGFEDRLADEFAIDETEGTLFALARAVEQRDHQTAGHCERLAFISVALGMAMGLERAQLLALYRNSPKDFDARSSSAAFRTRRS